MAITVEWKILKMLYSVDSSGQPVTVRSVRWRCRAFENAVSAQVRGTDVVNSRHALDGLQYEVITEEIAIDAVKAFNPGVEQSVIDLAEQQLMPGTGLGLPWEARHPIWMPDTAYALGALVTYQGVVYEAIQAHTSQSGWVPPAVPALWKTASDPDSIPDWVQPLGSEDAYPVGALVCHVGKAWESEQSANVWEPGVFGWIERPDINSCT